MIRIRVLIESLLNEEQHKGMQRLFDNGVNRVDVAVVDLLRGRKAIFGIWNLDKTSEKYDLRIFVQIGLGFWEFKDILLVQ